MTTTAATASRPAVDLPHGTWELDATHSSVTFEVEHAGLSIFRGGFAAVEARLVSGDEGLRLEGWVPVGAISVEDENIRPHLLSPEFFDSARHPTIEFRSTDIGGSAETLVVAGELSMAGASRAVEARGTLRGPAEGPGGGRKLALALETTVDRTDYGMDWQMEMPGGALALGLEVRLVANLELNLA